LYIICHIALFNNSHSATTYSGQTFTAAEFWEAKPETKRQIKMIIFGANPFHETTGLRTNNRSTTIINEGKDNSINVFGTMIVGEGSNFSIPGSTSNQSLSDQTLPRPGNILLFCVTTIYQELLFLSHVLL